MTLVPINRRAPIALLIALALAALALTLPAPAADAKPLKRGARGDRVVKLQRALGLPADGLFGKRTVRAVKRFQRRHRLTVDGIVGRATWRAVIRRRASPAGTASEARPSAGTSVRARVGRGVMGLLVCRPPTR